MIPFEEACWHEAGHTVLAALSGVQVMRTLVLENAAKTDWVGVAALNMAHADQRAFISTGGTAGELFAKSPVLSLATATDLQRARNRSGDDRQIYAQTKRSSDLSFDDRVAQNAWQAIAQNQTMFLRIGQELIARKVIGPLAYAHASAGFQISDTVRAADDDFLVQYNHSRPIPPPP